MAVNQFEIQDQEWNSLDELRTAFEWEIPTEFNAGEFLCDRWVAKDEDRTAVFYHDETVGQKGTLTFEELRTEASRLANTLQEYGLEKGDRVGVNVPRKKETLIAYIALWRAGMVPVPLSTLFGPDGLRYRLNDSDAKVAIVDAQNIDAFRACKDELESLEETLLVGDIEPEADEVSYTDAVSDASPEFDVVETAVDDDLLLMYTSGTTGDPKGVRHAHRSILGQLPGIVTNFYNMRLDEGEVTWCPTEYSWAGTITFIVASWAFGYPFVAHENNESFDPEEGFSTIENYDVTVSLIPPSGLRMMMQVEEPADRYDLSSLRHITSGGEALGSAVPEWANEVFGGTIHEVYGQTEIWNMVIGDCTALEEFKGGWMGFALPGHEIEILDPDTHEPLEPGEIGEIAVKRDDPTVFKEYWGKPEKTDEKFAGEWVLTEDLGQRDEKGRFKFEGRKDDVIISASYRIGPDEVEDSIVAHEAVADAGVIGVPDEERGEVPKAFVILMDGHDPTPDLRDEIQAFVRDNLAAYEYPRQIEFIDELPRTTTGKVRRSTLREQEGLDD